MITGRKKKIVSYSGNCDGVEVNGLDLKGLGNRLSLDLNSAAGMEETKSEFRLKSI